MVDTNTKPIACRQSQASRSCLNCHKRKIRCDKGRPCANCERGDLFCSFPEQRFKPRRKERPTVLEVEARLKRLEERSLSVFGPAERSDVEVMDQESKTLPAPALSGSNSQELLVQGSDADRYVNENLLSRILKGEHELQSSLQSPADDSVVAQLPINFLECNGIFSQFSKSINIHGLQPNKKQAMQLWRIFVVNIDPITRILHIPTIEPLIFNAINCNDDINHDFHSLLFAIYFSATTTLSTTAALDIFARPKELALVDFKQGLEASLAKANFLDSPNITTIQALTIYLTCLRVHIAGRSIWVLYGVAMRSAQYIGLHRDGTNFNLPPFQVEMRRRLWHFMCVMDIRGAEDHGISIALHTTASDTHLPLNIDDLDIWPHMKEYPKPKTGWTTMTFVVLGMEISQILNQLYCNPATKTANNQAQSQRLQHLKLRLEEEYMRFCDLNIPIQRATFFAAQLLLAKAEFVITQQQQHKNISPSSEQASNHEGKELQTLRAEQAFATACYILELNRQLQTDCILHEFYWLFESFVQYHALTYLLWNLGLPSASPSVEQAWIAVEAAWEHIEARMAKTGEIEKIGLLRALKSRALQARTRAVMMMGGQETIERSEVIYGMAEVGVPDFYLNFTDSTFWEPDTAYSTIYH